MPVQDRTNEFHACVESIRTRSSLPARGSDAKQRLLQAHGKSGGKSDFSRMAAGIGKDISSANIKLGKLAQCERKDSLFGCSCTDYFTVAKRKTLFDDRPVEISVRFNLLPDCSVYIDCSRRN